MDQLTLSHHHVQAVARLLAVAEQEFVPTDWSIALGSAGAGHTEHSWVSFASALTGLTHALREHTAHLSQVARLIDVSFTSADTGLAAQVPHRVTG